ncbi:hypothetical protein IFR05_012164 [Cadophora sp. M221]|nr:hypothetical protein IFR05_012164 [Cadophora sp. M221]
MLADRLLKITLEQLSGHDDGGEGDLTLDPKGDSVVIGGREEMMLDRTGGAILVGELGGTTAGVEEARRGLDVGSTAGVVLVGLTNERVLPDKHTRRQMIYGLRENTSLAAFVGDH